jgi:hypothetical protein
MIEQADNTHRRTADIRGETRDAVERRVARRVENS